MNPALPKPFERSYWVVPGKLLAGSYPGAENALEAAARLAALLDAGIRCVIALTEPEETRLAGRTVIPYEPVLQSLAQTRGVRADVEHHPIRDMEVPSPADMRRVLDAIDARLAADQPVYVHCRGGYGRTGTVVGCWLARHGLASGPNALIRLRELRTGMKGDSPQTEAQRTMVATWPPGQ